MSASRPLFSPGWVVLGFAGACFQEAETSPSEADFWALPCDYDADCIVTASALPACTPREPGERLDLGAGCADAACVGETYGTMLEILGPPESCLFADELGGRWTCVWQESELRVVFGGSNPSAPTPEARALELGLYPGWDGADTQGLGLEISFRCYTASLGPPDEIGIYTWNEASVIGTMGFYEPLPMVLYKVYWEGAVADGQMNMLVISEGVGDVLVAE